MFAFLDKKKNIILAINLKEVILHKKNKYKKMFWHEDYSCQFVYKYSFLKMFLQFLTIKKKYLLTPFCRIRFLEVC